MYKLIVTGKLARDPETRYTPNAKMVVNFSIPANIGYGDNKKTVWVRCTAWEKAGENIAKFFKKGDWIEVEGPVDVRAYTNREGTPVASLELTVRSWEFGPKGKNHDEDDGGEPSGPMPAVDHEDDLPF